MKIGIFATPEGYERSIVEACKELDVQYEIIGIFSHDWIQQFEKADCDGYIIRPPTKTSLWRATFLNRILLIKDRIENKCVPDIESILYYESKIMMLDFYKLNELPHVPSNTFFNLKEALKYAKSTKTFPKMVKSDGGSGSLGVKKINSRSNLIFQIYKSFFTGNIFRGFHSPADFNVYIKTYIKPLWMYFKKMRRSFYPYSERSQGYIHIQEFLQMKTEWRIIKIGESYFGLRKAKGKNGLRSGSGSRGDWTDPPKEILNLVKEWCERLNISTMSFDIFEDMDGEYLINEMQVCFGTISPSQMYINGVPGRYVHVGGKWVFDEGEYCRFNCNLLRIELLKEILYGKESLKPLAMLNN
ncbi:hypothetical protein [Chengkuizengella axinellae]|uniref:ATP-grasp domain-containing protein n=1 Tax=Chengkuizengella axinellae TaxID=3064388 RepID=A0ABT9J002_9BACL|nr:hypothetical protein [Chengkuizengella sp. 2205SS18-9]MDP5274712.1 hypothetical protein [Chengkuizengella sp. 2205SS18-9]